MAFLGGKYLQPEQVITGNVQTFRAREAATGRSVFVHRIAETAQPEQAALLKLLLSCLYRSSAVKELVLDVREEGDLCFVVTESVPQCLLLREWLQFESDRSDPGTKPAGGGTPLRTGSDAPVPQRSSVSGTPQRPEPPAQARPAPGEFTRMFQALDPSKVETVSRTPPPAQAPVRPVTPIPPESGKSNNRLESLENPELRTPKPAVPGAPGEFTRLFQAPAQIPPAKAPEASKDVPAGSLRIGHTPHVPPSGQPSAADLHGAPGEFTRLFEAPAQRSVSEPASPRPASPGTAVPNPKPGPGEFTRFFGGGSPAPNPEGFSFPAVQRPIPPQNAAAPSQSPGEFTQLFSGETPPPAAPAPYAATSAPPESFRRPHVGGPGGTAGEFTRIFGSGTERPSSPGASNSAGEYTQLFGTNDPAPVQPPEQPAFAAGLNVSPLNERGPSRQPPKPAPQGPSEFTRVVMGSAAAPAEPVPAAVAMPTAPPSANAMPGFHVPAAPPAPAIPAMPRPAVPAAPAPVLQPGNKPNKALLLLFLILFLLAVALVTAIAVTAKH